MECESCYWGNNCMFSGRRCEYYSPMGDFIEVEYIQQMVDRSNDYQSIINDFSDGNR
jgi:hypothetical protein